MVKNAVRTAFAVVIVLCATPVLAVTVVQPPAVANVNTPIHVGPAHAEEVPSTSSTYLKVGGWLIVVVAFALIGGISRRRSPSRIVAS